ncbi:hypothetical protein [Mesorhizobium sp. L2C084A000]|uniref:hypothetical protein n=1 Tax=Mesorhizobium sp. L2C084A000 TaxID=1287116 RepID=UPI0012DF5B16|nr:hypothetical protein [Mesorhizobium sp. L2C084A000]
MMLVLTALAVATRLPSAVCRVPATAILSLNCMILGPKRSGLLVNLTSPTQESAQEQPEGNTLMANDFAGLTDQQLLEARRSYQELLKRARQAIDNFDQAPLPTNQLARDKLLESHNKLWEATEAALTELDELARLRVSDV